jgi:hypothetical protein
LYDATLMATQMLPGEGIERIVVLTDGADENADNTGPGSDASEEAAVAAVRASGATLTAVAFGEAASVPALQALAAAGQGEVVDAAAAGDLVGHLRRRRAEHREGPRGVRPGAGRAGRQAGRLAVTARAGSQTITTVADTTLARVEQAPEPSSSPRQPPPSSCRCRTSHR